MKKRDIYVIGVIFCAVFFIYFILHFNLGADRKENSYPEELSLEERIWEEGDESIVVGFSQIGSESDWRIANTESYKSAFSEENGYYLVFEDAQQKQENQIKSIRNFILQEVDYIVLIPIVEAGWDMVLQEAKAAGIPVILADRFVDVDDDTLYTCWVGSNVWQEGVSAGEWLEQYLKAEGRDEETINIVTLQGTMGSSPQIGRTGGFQSVADRNSNWNILEQQSGDFTQAKGQEVMEYFLDTYDDIDVVISENDNMTLGAIDAIHEAGKTCGPDGEITILSFDATQAAFSAMLNGDIDADFECNPLLGPLVSDIIQRLEKGEEVEKFQYVHEEYFDTSMDLEKIIQTRTY